MNSHYLLRDILGTTIEGESAEVLEMAERGTARALKITEELLEHRRPKKPALEEIDVRELIEEVIETTPNPQGISVTVDAHSVTVQADPSYLTRILTNLVMNAYQAMPQGGWLYIAASTVEGTDVITLQDSGEGFTPDVAHQVFDPFVTTREGGTGLGLAIVQRLVDAHHGSISTENATTGGALVTVRLPHGRSSRVERTWSRSSTPSPTWPATSNPEPSNK
jgi:signal transduction histidine kinase